MDDMRTYLKTNNQEILNRVKKYSKDTLDLHKEWKEFEDKYHVKLFGYDQSTGNVSVDGVIGDTSVFPGEWTKPNRRGVSSPFKRNKEARRMLSRMDLKAPNLGDDIPALTLETPLWGDANAYFINTVFFEYDGFVYVSVGKSVKPDTGIWSPIRKWEFDKAEEERNAKIQS